MDQLFSSGHVGEIYNIYIICHLFGTTSRLG